MVNKILFITLSNIGDVLLTLPVLDSLRAYFPEARITVISGERARGIFEGNPHIANFIPFDKHARLRGKIQLVNSLRKERFDMVVDLRKTFLGAFLAARYKTPLFLPIPKNIKHMRQRHSYRARNLLKRGDRPSVFSSSLYFNPEDESRVNALLKENNIGEKDKIVVIASGARSHTKRWPKERFVELASRISGEFPVKIVLVGDKDDAGINQYLARQIKAPVLDLSARTSLSQLGLLLKKASLLISNDSAPMHLASYLGVPVVAVFGISDDRKYGPWSAGSVVVKKEISCRPCKKAQCKFGTLECISLVKVEDVFRAVKEVLAVHHPPSLPVRQAGTIHHPNDFNRILIARTDRIGDVLLSTPVIKALRERYPRAYIAMMVSPYARDVVEGNPYLDKVIILDKDAKRKNWLRSFGFIRELKKNKFDLALILHPTNRVHLLTFSGGIPKRIGYKRKLGFLLTNGITHSKQLGLKHERDYNLDLLRYLGVEVKDKTLFMPIMPESEKWAEDLFRREGINSSDRLLALNPAASCPSKIWPAERFSQAADKLAQKYGFKILVIAGPKDIQLADNLIKHLRSTAINLAGKTSVSQLASLLKRCALFISNDSGPAHIASAVGTPVISIFGRNQAGLSPKRWGPVGEKDKTLHKAVCLECLAHNCQKDFACLKAVTVDDVVSAADEILKS